jgi:dTDP-4-dehydrorhamnose 3,5-epimerase
MSRFNFIQTPLSGLKLIQRKALEDHRGFFSRFYCVDEFANAGINIPIVQINHTLTCNKGTVRGLHFQYPPHAETKLVSCLKGAIWDVTIDLRNDSKTYLKWHGEILSAKNKKSLYIPKGFAHGFQTLTDDCELIYLHSAVYEPSAEGVINVRDSKICIDWPDVITEISDRDTNAIMINNKFKGITLE